MPLATLCPKHGVYQGKPPCPTCAEAKPKWTHKKPTVRTSVYKSDRWRKLRPRILARDKYQCRYGMDGCTRKATVVAHIEPYRDEHDPLAWLESNLAGSCANCNNKEAARRLNQLRREARHPGRGGLESP
jgi:5-methylcytosine-specific restriction endonuclease McrA